MATNDFQTFAAGGGANVLTQAQYLALTSILANGFSAGVAPSAQLNKVWRQSSIISTMIAQFIVDQSAQNAADDGTTATLEANFIAAIRSATKTGVILADTGAVNAYTAVNVPPLVSGTWVDGVVQQVKIAHANTGASTYAPDGLTAIPIYGLGLQPLQGSELALNGTAILMRATIAGVNSGNPIAVLMECAGGAQQIPPATQSQHAVQMGQVTGLTAGRLLRTAVYTNVGGTQFVSINGGTATTTGATTHVPLAATTTIIGEAQGGGGGGGGGSGAGASAVSMGAPGGAGSYGKAMWSIGVFGASQSISVGAGGSGAVSAGANGATSSIGALLSAPGGQGGGISNNVTPPSVNGNGAVSTAVTGSGILYSIRGTTVQATFGLSTSAGIAGNGGASPYGAGGSGPGLNTNGTNAANYGSGGSGVLVNQAGGNGTGGNGFAGIVTISEYA
jgi:hypothetical protein